MRNLPHGRASWAPTKDQLLQAGNAGIFIRDGQAVVADNGWEASYPVSEWQDVVALAKRFKRTL
ncbi:MAG: hypothetical protein E6R03_13800 [Hyphomicrobiaceae bacterium]|nr:MAG: hypothetical protein E6R03_13800 [Hyphomicrobiaceae bacterium]